MMVNLQTIISVFWDDPIIYNTATYFICGALLLIWSVTTLRFRSSPARLWLALAAIAALSMLPFYHRQQDTRLLLLTVPACVMLWTEGGLIGWLALMVNTAGFVLAGDIPWIVFYGLIDKVHLPATRLSGQILMAMQVFPVPLILLTMGIFYLWIYVRRCSTRAPA
jgi:hypothetical protein